MVKLLFDSEYKAITIAATACLLSYKNVLICAQYPKAGHFFNMLRQKLNKKH